MLTLALAATLIGFVLLILGLVTGSVWLAVACIVVCLLGVVFLIADVIGAGRRDREPSFDVRSDDAATADRSDTHATSATGAQAPAADTIDADTTDANRVAAVDTAAVDTGSATGAASAYTATTAPTVGAGAAPATAGGGSDRQEGGLSDYLRSVGASPAADTPTPAAPSASSSNPPGVAAGWGAAGPQQASVTPPTSLPPHPGPPPQLDHGDTVAAGGAAPPSGGDRQQGEAWTYRPGRTGADQPPTAPAEAPSAPPIPGRRARVDEESGRPGADRDPSDARDERDAGTPRRSAAERWRSDDPNATFDPLDPHWHPPLD